MIIYGPFWPSQGQKLLPVNPLWGAQKKKGMQNKEARNKFIQKEDRFIPIFRRDIKIIVVHYNKCLLRIEKEKINENYLSKYWIVSGSLHSYLSKECADLRVSGVKKITVGAPWIHRYTPVYQSAPAPAVFCGLCLRGHECHRDFCVPLGSIFTE